MLTDEQLNIAICEWRGWEKASSGGWIAPATRHGATSKLPSHITGIEALGNMREAEKGLTENQKQDYANQIATELKAERVLWKEVDDFAILSATARQRAIALLRVVKPEVFE